MRVRTAGGATAGKEHHVVLAAAHRALDDIAVLRQTMRLRRGEQRQSVSSDKGTHRASLRNSVVCMPVVLTTANTTACEKHGRSKYSWLSRPPGERVRVGVQRQHLVAQVVLKLRTTAHVELITALSNQMRERGRTSMKDSERPDAV